MQRPGANGDTPEAQDAPASFGDLLRRYRLGAGLTQEQLAERAKLSARAVSDLERGRRRMPYPATVELLAKALELTAEDRASLRAVIPKRRPTQEWAYPVLASPLTPALPLELTPLVGREQDEAAVVHLIQQEGKRLVTLTGVGGVGKSRLALRVAATLYSDFDDGARFVSLAPLSSAEQVAPAIIAALAVQSGQREPPDQTLSRVLRDRQTLLVLDNFEHLLPAARLVTDLLSSCSRLVVLATSREPLRLRAEQEFEVLPLIVPGPRDLEGEEQLNHYAACALFLTRARAVSPGFKPTGLEGAAVAEICRYLDGVPLAIELAAAQIRYSSAQQLLARLERRFDVLVGGPRDAPSRQQTMRACIAWSVDQLGVDEEDVLCRLAVFVGGGSIDALAAVVRGPCHTGADVEPLLHALVDKSLVIVNRVADGEPRFTMLETVREYALERLRDGGRSEEAYAAFGRFFRELAEESRRQQFLPGETPLLLRLALERDNLRAVLEWALDHDLELGLSIAGAANRFWDLDGRYQEWRTWIERALSMNVVIPPAIRARAMVALGWQVLHLGDFPVAVDWYREALSIARDLDDPLLTNSALIGFGLAELSQGHLAQAEALFVEGIDVCREAEMTEPLGSLAYGLGLTCQLRGDPEGARRHLENAATLLRAQGETMTKGAVTRALGAIVLQQGNYPEARRWFREGLQDALAIAHREGSAGALQGIAATYAPAGRIELAARLWGAGQRILDELYGTARTAEEIPLARLPQFSPHLSRMRAYFDDPRWGASCTEGYMAPLESAIAVALEGLPESRTLS